MIPAEVGRCEISEDGLVDWATLGLEDVAVAVEVEHFAAQVESAVANLATTADGTAEEAALTGPERRIEVCGLVASGSEVNDPAHGEVAPDS